MNYVATTYIVHTSYKTFVSDRYTFDGCLLPFCAGLWDTPLHIISVTL